MNLTEDKEQELFFRWADLKGLPAFHIPNGGRRNPAEAAHLRRLGVKPGVPDIFLPVAAGGYHGLFVEMKRRKGGRVSEAQQEWIELLQRQGYLAAVCKGFDEARALVEEYTRGS